MTVTQAPSNRYLERPAPSSLADVINVILDKGLVIDIYIRVSLVGIELLTIDARIVIASVDTYLRFAEAVNRLDLTETELAGLPELQEKGAEEITEHKIESMVGEGSTLRDAAKGIAAGAVVAGAAAAAKALSDRRSDGEAEQGRT